MAALCVEDYDVPAFRRVLTADERNALVGLAHSVVMSYKDYGSLPRPAVLDALVEDVDRFLSTESPDKLFFLRLSTMSPKDAAEHLVQVAAAVPTIAERLSVLCVTGGSGGAGGERVLQVLCHSFRCMIDLEYVCDVDLAVLLLPWIDDLVHLSEVRCFVRHGRVVAITQYYCGDDNGSDDGDEKETTINRLPLQVVGPYADARAYMDAVRAMVEGLPRLSGRERYSVDVGQGGSDGRLIRIECNPWDDDDTLDTCLFDSSDDCFSDTNGCTFAYLDASGQVVRVRA